MKVIDIEELLLLERACHQVYMADRILTDWRGRLNDTY